jgi:5,10-methylenetetrahydrofolate reductase
VMPITSYKSYARITNMCQLSIPPLVESFMYLHKDDEPSVIRKYGIDLCACICKELRDAGEQYIHVYTMNDVDAVCSLLDIVEE